MNYKDLISEALHQVKDISVQRIMFSPVNQTITVIFKMNNKDLWLAKQNMKAIVAVVQQIGTNGYRLRMGAQMENGLMGLIVTLSEEAVRDFNASAEAIEWAEIADDYHIERELRRWLAAQQKKMLK